MVYRIKGIFVSSEKDLLTATVNIHYLSSFILICSISYVKLQSSVLLPQFFLKK